MVPYEPKFVKTVLLHSSWKAAMLEELAKLHQNNTWRLVPRTSDLHIIGSKWVCKAKLKANKTLDRLKARSVAKVFHQLDGVDYTKNFSPVIKPNTICLIFSVALVKNWPIR